MVTDEKATWQNLSWKWNFRSNWTQPALMLNVYALLCCGLFIPPLHNSALTARSFTNSHHFLHTCAPHYKHCHGIYWELKSYCLAAGCGLWQPGPRHSGKAARRRLRDLTPALCRCHQRLRQHWGKDKKIAKHLHANYWFTWTTARTVKSGRMFWESLPTKIKPWY